MEHHLRAGPLWPMITACFLRSMRVTDLASDLISLRLLYDQIQSRQCIWHRAGRQLCPQLLAAMSACVGGDFVFSLVLVMFTTQMLRSRSRKVLALHIGIHVLAFLCEVGIAAITISLLLHASDGSEDRRGMSTSNVLFFGAASWRIQPARH